MLELHSPITRLYGVGDKLAEKLAALGLETVQDLVYFYPRRYEDFSRPRTIDQVTLESHVIIKARVQSIENDLSPRQHIKLTHAFLTDDTGLIEAVWFNQPFLIRLLKPGTTWLFAGKVELGRSGKVVMSAPVIEREAKILPVYPETVGLTSKQLRKWLYEIKPVIEQLPEPLTESQRQDYDLTSLNQALLDIHFPPSIEAIGRAKKRLAFDELLTLLLQVQLSQRQLADIEAPQCPVATEVIKTFVANLPFPLTDSQRQVSWEIIQDLSQPVPMNRLLEGDVGSGKTVVGAIASLGVVKAGYRVVWLAPTEILAQQHYQTIKSLLADQASVTLLTGSTSKTNQEWQTADIVIGTQAVIQERIQLTRLGLIIVDEQHRFGVNQRNHLVAKEDRQLTPHCLALTATPIPRSLALTIYGDLAISQLQTRPTGRLLIVSRLVHHDQRLAAYQFIRQQVKQGHQVFVVCPIIDASRSDTQLTLFAAEKKAVLSEHQRLQGQIFPDLRVGLLHGRMKPKEKEQVMLDFKEGRLDILVSTAVIEVGIDIPNATVMMIEGADRFGLAQLHQFRGRVGRSIHQSYCLVFTDSEKPETLERLQAFVSTESGFELAELDLKLRGPGQLAGLAQSGLSGLKIASLSDIALIQQAKQLASVVMKEGLERYPTLRDELERTETVSLT